MTVSPSGITAQPGRGRECAGHGGKLQWYFVFPLCVVCATATDNFLNVIYLKCFVMEPPCFECDTFEKVEL